MSYDDERFWDSYGEFLEESKERHIDVISTLLPLNNNQSIVDLGCGQYASAADLIPHNDYMGIDQFNPGKRSSKDSFNFIQANYRNFQLKSSFDGFVSLFSAEVTAPEQENRSMYHQIFKNTNASWGLVSGFYYRSKMDQEVVEETGGIKSYQTLPWLPPFSTAYSTKQICVSAPSKMFGPDVVEVWRLMTRVVHDHEEFPTTPSNPPPARH